MVAVAQGRAPAVAAGAGLDLLGGACGLEVHGEAGVGQGGLAGRGLQVVGGRAVTGLAANAEAVPAAVEALLADAEIALVAGGVAFHTHEVGVLAGLAPVQRVLEVNALARIQVEPLLLAGIPGHAQGLQASLADLDQVLLQGLDAEGVGHLEVRGPAVGAGGVDPELGPAAKQPGAFAFGLETLFIEIAQHRLRVGLLHRQLMVRALPVPGLGLVAALAGLFIDVLGGRQRRHGLGLGGGRGRSHLRRRQPGRFGQQEPGEPAEHQQQQQGAEGEQVAVGRRCS